MFRALLDSLRRAYEAEAWAWPYAPMSQRPPPRLSVIDDDEDTSKTMLAERDPEDTTDPVIGPPVHVLDRTDEVPLGVGRKAFRVFGKKRGEEPDKKPATPRKRRPRVVTIKVPLSWSEYTRYARATGEGESVWCVVRRRLGLPTRPEGE